MRRSACWDFCLMGGQLGREDARPERWSADRFGLGRGSGLLRSLLPRSPGAPRNSRRDQGQKEGPRSRPTAP